MKLFCFIKNDFSKFEEKCINDVSLLNWNNIWSDYMDANTKFAIFNDEISQFINTELMKCLYQDLDLLGLCTDNGIVELKPGQKTDRKQTKAV